MSITLVQHTAVSATGVLAYGSNTAAGNLLVACVSYAWTTTDPGASISGTNTWTPLPIASNSGGPLSTRIFYCLSALGGAETITVTGPTFSGTSMVAVTEFNGGAGSTWSFDNHAEATGNSTSLSASVPVAGAGELSFAVCRAGSGPLTAGQTQIDIIGTTSNNIDEWTTSSGAGTQSMTASVGSAHNWAVSGASFIVNAAASHFIDYTPALPVRQPPRRVPDDAWEPSPPQTKAFLDWAVFTAPQTLGRPNRKILPYESEAWEPSPPQPAEFQTWTPDVQLPRSWRRLPADTVLVDERPAPTLLLVWSNDVRGPTPRRQQPWEGESVPPAPPQMTEFQNWSVELPPRGKAPRRQSPWEPGGWEESPPQTTGALAWLVDVVVGRPPRRQQLWEADAWVPTSPQTTAALPWTVDPVRGAPPRVQRPWEGESVVPAPPQLSRWLAWSADPTRSPWRPLPAETAAPVDALALPSPTSFVPWTNDLRPRPWIPTADVQPWLLDDVVPPPVSFSGWTIDVARPSWRRPPPAESPPVLGAAPPELADWAPDGPRRAPAPRRPDDAPWLGQELAVAPFLAWADAPSPAPERSHPADGSTVLGALLPPPPISTFLDWTNEVRVRVRVRSAPDNPWIGVGLAPPPRIYLQTTAVSMALPSTGTASSSAPGEATRVSYVLPFTPATPSRTS